MASFRSSRAAENCLLDKGTEMRTEITLDLNRAVLGGYRGLSGLSVLLRETAAAATAGCLSPTLPYVPPSDLF